jgi:CARDB
MRLTCRQPRNYLVAVGLGLTLPVAGTAIAVVPSGGPRARARRRPDLLVSTAKAPGGRLTVGGAVTASITTTNVGGAPSTRSRTGLYLSNDTKKSRDDFLLGFARVPTLKPHESKRATIRGTVPSGIPPAGYRILACADDKGRVRERSERNNCRGAPSTLVVLAETSGGSGGSSGGGSSGGGSADDDHDGYPNAVDCAPENPTVHPGAPDPPDPAFKDSNCDGIDGEASQAIFVSGLGSDSNPGTQSQPKQTLAAAMPTAAVQGKDVYATLGDYHEALVVANGVGVFGGYDASWNRSLSNQTRILGARGAFGDTEAAVAFGATASTTLQLLTLSPGAPQLGRSSYGLRGVDSGGLRLQLLTVQAAAGADGLSGLNGSTGADGGGGASGVGYERGGGGTSPVGHTGGNGGYGGISGEAGREGAPGLLASPDQWGLQGGPGGAGGAGDPTHTKGASGYAGDSGHFGANGAGGAAGNAAEGSGYWISGHGGNGQAGSGGHGGGGGGGGGAESEFGCCNEGGGGGGGGGGGAGGGGGQGGQGGGGSFGIFLVESAGARVEDSSIAASNGGAGGGGGGGAYGGTGGPIGFGGSPVNAASAGGAGGPGGDGGRGGDGGGGSGGPSVAIFGITEADAPGTTVSHGSGGAGGPGGLGSGFGAPGGADGVAADFM